MAKESFEAGFIYDLVTIARQYGCLEKEGYRGCYYEPRMYIRFDIKMRDPSATQNPTYDVHIGIKFPDRTDYWDFIVEGGHLRMLDSVMGHGFLPMTSLSKHFDPTITILPNGQLDVEHSYECIRVGDPNYNASRVFLYPNEENLPYNLRPAFFAIKCVGHYPL